MSADERKLSDRDRERIKYAQGDLPLEAFDTQGWYQRYPDEPGAPSCPEAAAQRNAVAGSPVEALITFIRRFVVLQHSEWYPLLALWILGTHLFQRFEYFGYLFIHSGEKESGKTRLLEVLKELVWNCEGIDVATTQAVLFRTTASTQLLDELDSASNRRVLRSVLNAGFQKGGTVPRANKFGQVERFEVYCPRALAGIGVKTLDDTTRSRSFLIQMLRQTTDARSEQFRVTVLKDEIKTLRSAIENWTKQNGEAIQKRYQDEKFPVLDSFNDRTIDLSQSLAAVLAIADEEDGEDRTKQLLAAIRTTRGEDDDLERQHEILLHLFSIAQRVGTLRCNASELAAHCASMTEPATPAEITRTLRKHNFETRSVRLKGESPKWRYVLPASALKDLVKRYIPQSNESENVVGVVTKNET